MKYVKNQFYETHYRSSTIPMGTMAGLGTIEKDSCSHFGKQAEAPFRGYQMLNDVCDNLKFKTVLDIGAGACLQSDFLRSKGRVVKTCDLGLPAAHCDSGLSYDFTGRFLDVDFEGRKYDFILASHTLEHQRNVGLFIDKMISLTNDGGFICIIVPPRKPFITGGHMTIWNPGLLLYNLVAAGLDCSNAYIVQRDYDIFVTVKKKMFDLADIKLTCDRGDVDLLQEYFPFELKEPFNGDIMHYNTLFDEECKK